MFVDATENVQQGEESFSAEESSRSSRLSASGTGGDGLSVSYYER